MKDFADLAPRVTGVFPDVAAKDDTIPGDKTGTPLAAFWVTELMGAFQAILNYASLTPSGSSETSGSSQILTALQTAFVDGLAGGTYSPSAPLTWNAGLVVDASAGPGTNVKGINATGKGSFAGGDFQGGSSAGYGITATGGANGKGGYFQGGSSADGITALGGSGGRGAYLSGGAGAYGAYIIGGSSYLGLKVVGGSSGGDAIWAVTATGTEPGSKTNDYAIWASTGGASAVAIFAKSNLGTGVAAYTTSGVGLYCVALGNGIPLKINPSNEPTDSVAEGCIYFNSLSHTLCFYNGSAWKTVAVV